MSRGIAFLAVVLGSLALFFLVWGIRALIFWFKERARSALLRNHAAKLGFEYVRSDGTKHLAYEDAALWQQHLCSETANILQGETDEGKLAYFDYRGAVADRGIYMSVCACNTGYMFRRLVLRMRHGLLGNDLARLLRAKPIALESAAFNNAFEVECEDKKFAYDILHQRAMEFLLDRPQIQMQLFGNCVFFWYERRLPIEGVESFIADTREFARMLPRYLAER